MIDSIPTPSSVENITTDTNSNNEQIIKHYVLDTNVLLHDPQAIFKFKENNVVIPIVVIEEIDRFKKELTERGRNARQFSRYLDQLRQRGKLSSGVVLEENGVLIVDLCDKLTNDIALEITSNDNKILATALNLSREGKFVVFVSKDTNMRIKADAYGISAVDYDDVRLRIDDLYTGYHELSVTTDLIDKFYSTGELVVDGLELYPQQYVVIKNSEKQSGSAIGRYNASKHAIVPIRKAKEGVWGLLPRNKEQVFALDLLMDDDIKLVSLVGKAGTGKTLLALAAGLQKTADEGKYRRLVVARPIFPLGKDIGFLPGDLQEKLTPWMKPIYDNLEYLTDSRKDNNKKTSQKNYEELISQGILEVEALTYIRGRSLPHQYLIVDEAQNLTPHEIKTIVTRAGEGTKVVLTGDPYQIDNPYIDSTNNGLTYVVERFKKEVLAGHISLTKGERSELAEIAANLL